MTEGEKYEAKQGEEGRRKRRKAFP